MDARPPHSDHNEPAETSDESNEVWAEPAASAAGDMGFLDHLEDLRWALIKTLAIFVLATGGITLFLTRFADLLMWPYHFAIHGREATATMGGLIMTSFLGVFSVVFQLLLMGGIAITAPFALYFLGEFVAPGLTQHEKKLLIPGCLLGLILFLFGASFSFFLVVPAMLKASVFFNEMMGFTLFITANSYYSLLTWSVLGIGAGFEFPLVLLLLVYLGVLSVERLKEWRRYSFVGFLIVAAAITPGMDPFSFIILTIPMYLLYELAIFLGYTVERMRAEAKAEAEADIDIDEE